MKKFKIYREENYLRVVDSITGEIFSSPIKNVEVEPNNVGRPVYKIHNLKDWESKNSINIEQILDEAGNAYSQSSWEDFYTANTANFNGGGTAPSSFADLTGSPEDNPLLLSELDTKVSKVTTPGLERTYIINPDGSQSTKATSDFNISADNGLNTSNDPKVVELGGRLTKDTIINTFKKSLVFLGVEDSGYLNIGAQPPYPTTLASLEIGTGAGFGFLKRGLQFFSNKTIVVGGTIEQDKDRSSEYTDRSLVDKQYTDSVQQKKLQPHAQHYQVTTAN